MTKEEKFIKKWERLVKNGKSIYIIKIFLIFIIVAPIVGTFMDLVISWDFSKKAINEVLQTSKIVSKIVVFAIVGIFLAYSSWNRGMKKYNIYKQYLNRK